MLLDDPPQSDRRPALSLVLAAHPGPAFAVTVMVWVLCVAVGLGATSTALAVGAVLTGQLSIGWSNDLLDAARDRSAGRTDKPLATGALSPRVVRTACRVALALTLALSLLLGWLPGGAQLVSVAAGWAYNLRLKATVWSWLPYAVAFGALATVPSLALPVVQVDWWLPAVGALLGVGAHLVNVLPDLDDDAATGVAGLPHRLAARWGAPAAAALAVALFVSATALVVTAVPFGAPAAVATALVAALAVLALVGGGRTPFRAAMAIALVCVVLLAVAV
ncbi:MAG: UbiA family prenyltransferase [Nocardioides sp.]